MSTHGCLPLLRKTLQALLDHLQQRGWAVNLQKIQGLGTGSKFLGARWSGKTCGIPKAIIDKVQGYPIPKEAQAFVVILGYW